MPTRQENQQFPIYEFRPIIEDFCGSIYRWNAGNPIEDDGKYDLAFFSLAGPPMVVSVEIPYRDNIIWSWEGKNGWGAHEPRHKQSDGNAWHYMTKDGSARWDIDPKWHVERDSHPNEVAHRETMNWVANRQSCANGSPIDFQIGEKYIVLGLLRVKQTEEIVRFPKQFTCYQCGDITEEVRKYIANRRKFVKKEYHEHSPLEVSG